MLQREQDIKYFRICRPYGFYIKGKTLALLKNWVSCYIYTNSFGILTKACILIT